MNTGMQLQLTLWLRLKTWHRINWSECLLRSKRANANRATNGLEMESMGQKWTCLDCLFSSMMSQKWSENVFVGRGITVKDRCDQVYITIHYPCHSSGRAKYPKVFAFAWLVVSLCCAGATLQELVQLQAMISSALQAQSDAVLRCGKRRYMDEDWLRTELESFYHPDGQETSCKTWWPCSFISFFFWDRGSRGIIHWRKLIFEHFLIGRPNMLGGFWRVSTNHHAAMLLFYWLHELHAIGKHVCMRLLLLTIPWHSRHV